MEEPKIPKPIETDKSVKIIDGHGVVVGNGNIVTQIFNGINEKVIKRFGLEQRIGFILIIILFIVLSITIILALRTPTTETMSGGFRIAVAVFLEKGQSGYKELGREIGDTFLMQLEHDLQEINPQSQIVFWGPDKVGTIKGNTAEKRAEAAEKIGQRIHADIVIYGVVDTSNNFWEIYPEFYLRTENFFDVDEMMSGQYSLGTPIVLRDKFGVLGRNDSGAQILTRTKALSYILMGLEKYAAQDYAAALETFEITETLPGWEKDQGKYVLYLLMGNAAGKLAQKSIQQDQDTAPYFLDLAEENYQRALLLDIEYARPYLGLASTYYLRALLPYQQSQNPANTDQGMLQKAIEQFSEAQEATNHPPRSDIQTKINFGLGQCYFAKVYASGADDYEIASSYFDDVITDYGNGKNTRIQELAAESHARLGLIHRLLGDTNGAIEEYQKAIDLLNSHPVRQQVYLERINQLKNQSP